MDLTILKVLEKIPPLGSQNNKGMEATVLAKFFTPWSYWSWYPIEFDGIDTFYGYVVGLEKEFGYFLLSELLELRGPFGLRIEVDKYFKPASLRIILDKNKIFS